MDHKLKYIHRKDGGKPRIKVKPPSIRAHLAPTKMILTIELVPKTVWYSSLYHLLPKHEWDTLKQDLYAEEGRECYICESTSKPLEAHEFWKYDDKLHIQKLVGIHHLCTLCHKIKHIGFWCYTSDGMTRLAEEGFTRRDLVKHFCAVNKVSRKVFERYEDEALRVWRKRSRHEWKQDLDKYNIYVKEGLTRP